MILHKPPPNFGARHFRASSSLNSSPAKLWLPAVGVWRDLKMRLWRDGERLNDAHMSG